MRSFGSRGAIEAVLLCAYSAVEHTVVSYSSFWYAIRCSIHMIMFYAKTV